MHYRTNLKKSLVNCFNLLTYAILLLPSHYLCYYILCTPADPNTSPRNIWLSKCHKHLPQQSHSAARGLAGGRVQHVSKTRHFSYHWKLHDLWTRNAFVNSLRANQTFLRVQISLYYTSNLFKYIPPIGYGNLVLKQQQTYLRNRTIFSSSNKWRSVFDVNVLPYWETSFWICHSEETNFKIILTRRNRNHINFQRIPAPLQYCTLGNLVKVFLSVVRKEYFLFYVPLLSVCLLSPFTRYVYHLILKVFLLT